MAEAFKEDHACKEDFWENEVKSLGMTQKTKWVNDKEKVEALAENCLVVPLALCFETNYLGIIIRLLF